MDEVRVRPILAAEREPERGKENSPFENGDHVVVFLSHLDPNVRYCWGNTYADGVIYTINPLGVVTVLLERNATWQGIFTISQTSVDILSLDDWKYFREQPEEYIRWLGAQENQLDHGQKIERSTRVRAFYDAIGRRDPMEDRKNLMAGDPVVMLRTQPEKMLYFGNMINADSMRVRCQMVYTGSSGLKSIPDKKTLSAVKVANAELNQGQHVRPCLIPRLDYETLLRQGELRLIMDYLQSLPDRRWADNWQFVASSFKHVPAEDLGHIVKFSV